MKPAVSLLILAVACGAPLAPNGATPIDPPANAAALWSADQACSGITGDLHRISWYVAGDTDFVDDAGHADFGLWVAPHSIYLSAIIADTTRPAVAGGNDIDREWVIRHEMLHDLTQSGAHGQVFATCGLL